MRTLECGCEILQDTGQFVSLCESHGHHVQARLEANKHPRHTIPSVDKAFERELVKLFIPLVFARTSAHPMLDQETGAQMVFQYVEAITKRLE